MSVRRVVITGVGLISPVGLTAQENWNALINCTSGIGPLTTLPSTTYPIKAAGEVKQFNPATYHIKPKSLKLMNKTIQYALAAADTAIEDAHLDIRNLSASSTIGLALGVEGIQYSVEELLLATYAAVGEDFSYYIVTPEGTVPEPIEVKDPASSVHPLWPLTVLPNMSLCHIAIAQSLRGPNLVFSSIDAAGAQAIGEAFRSIQYGEADLYIAGGSYALCTTQLLSFAALRLLSHNPNPEEACRPFDRNRDGGVLGEGSAILILEELSHAQQRGADIYAELVGYSCFFSGTEPGLNVSTTSPDSRSMERCMTMALADAGVTPAAIYYICADGKATVLGDQEESRAIQQAFGKHGETIPVSAHKSALGHLLPASGAAEAVLTALAIRNQCIPPTRNCTEKDSQCALNVVCNTPCSREIRYAISNTFGFTGEHTTLVLKQYTD